MTLNLFFSVITYHVLQLIHFPRAGIFLFFYPIPLINPICFFTSFLLQYSILSQRAIFSHDQKVRQIFLIHEEQSKLLIWKKKHFSLFIKGSKLKKTVSDLRVDLQV